MRQQRTKDPLACAGQQPARSTAERGVVLVEQRQRPGPRLPRVQLHPSAPTPADILALQRAIGNQAVGRLLAPHQPRAAAQTQRQEQQRPLSEATSQARPLTIQRITLEEAIQLADELSSPKSSQFGTRIQPVLLAMARKDKGKDLVTYLAGLKRDEYADIVQGILEPIGIKQVQSPATHPITYQKATELPGFYEVAGTNIYIDRLNIKPQQVSQATQPTGLLSFMKRPTITTTTQFAPTNPGVGAFVQSILQSGPLQWYRGMAINHFAWAGLRQGSLASEGTDKLPTFTMGSQGDSLTRWLPGATGDAGEWTAKVFTSPQESGLVHLAKEGEVVVGAVLNYAVTPQTPIAYMNGNEQQLRGPISAPKLKVVWLVVWKNGQPEYRRPASSELQDLPPTYPYEAELGSHRLIAWMQEYNEWAETHGFDLLPMPEGASALISRGPTLTVAPDMSLQHAFAILNLPFGPTLSLETLIAQYKQLAMRYHPDRNFGHEEEAMEMFKKVGAAYARIKDGAEEREIKLVKQG